MVTQYRGAPRLAALSILRHSLDNSARDDDTRWPVGSAGAAAPTPEPRIRRVLRERAGLRQDELAEALGASRPAVTRWALGQRTPRGDLAERYAAALDRLAGGPAMTEPLPDCGPRCDPGELLAIESTGT
jgi:DNA-binding XRE family transcriptional regulator